MERPADSNYHQDLWNLFALYVHGDIDRRGFLERAAKFAVGGVTTAVASAPGVPGAASVRVQHVMSRLTGGTTPRSAFVLAMLLAEEIDGGREVHHRLIRSATMPPAGPHRHPGSGDGRETKFRPQRGAERVERLGAERFVG